MKKPLTERHVMRSKRRKIYRVRCFEKLNKWNESQEGREFWERVNLKISRSEELKK